VDSVNSVVAFCNSHSEAEEAVRDLQKSGLDMKKLSIVGRDYRIEEHVVGYYTTGDRMKDWGKMGAFCGGIFGLVVGWTFFWFPGFGLSLVARPVVSWILAALEAAVLGAGLSALAAGLYGMGIPKDSVLRYGTAVKAGKYLLVVYGSADEIDRARQVLGVTRADALARHPAGFVTPAASSRAYPMQVPVHEKEARMFGATNAEN
jgi:uncharacterized membrane protein